MNLSDLRKCYGDEYPAAVLHDGMRIALTEERRFSRVYYAKKEKIGVYISRFMDESTAMTSCQLQEEWAGWTESERNDFCNHFGWLSKQPDFPEMLRFIMEHGGPSEWSAAALGVAGGVPIDEGFEILLRALRTIDLAKSTNVVQAIAFTKHRDAKQTIHDHLELVWADPKLWDDDTFLNWLAFCATKCIAYLIQLGAPPREFEEQVRQLSKHPCSGNRDSCRQWLGKHYEWLSESVEPPLP
jgi:hypothetical protein